MSDTLQLLLTRRSIPAVSLGAPGPDAETLRHILTAAARVPDHGKLAPWRFVLFEGEMRERAGALLCQLWLKRESGADAVRLEAERMRLSRAPVVVAVVSKAAPHPKIPEWEQVLSAGAVCMNMLTAAHAAGFSAQWLTEWYAYDEEAGRILGLAPGERFAGFIHIGTPQERPFERPRPDLEAIVSSWREPGT